MTRTTALKSMRRSRRGLGLVEVLLSLAIASMLLTAVATAFSASTAAIRINDEFSRATQSGRVCLHHLLTEARRGYVDESWSADEISIITAAGDDRTYRYLPDLKQIVLVTNDDTTDRDYVLARNVIQSPFTVEQGTNWKGQPCVAQVSVVVAVEVEGHIVRLSGSASPRRNLVYAAP
jgi:type II secretory pathway pseudopilin PulG